MSVVYTTVCSDTSAIGQVIEDGYCVAPRSDDGEDRTEIVEQELVDKLAFAASVLEYYGWPTTFLAIYDEA